MERCQFRPAEDPANGVFKTRLRGRRGAGNRADWKTVIRIIFPQKTRPFHKTNIFHGENPVLVKKFNLPWGKLRHCSPIPVPVSPPSPGSCLFHGQGKVKLTKEGGGGLRRVSTLILGLSNPAAGVGKVVWFGSCCGKVLANFPISQPNPSWLVRLVFLDIPACDKIGLFLGLRVLFQTVPLFAGIFPVVPSALAGNVTKEEEMNPANNNNRRKPPPPQMFCPAAAPRSPAI